MTRSERWTGFLFFVAAIMQVTLSQEVEDSPETRLLLQRIRDTTGHFHPELHGDHVHAHSSTGGESQGFTQIINLQSPLSEKNGQFSSQSVQISSNDLGNGQGEFHSVSSSSSSTSSGQGLENLDRNFGPPGGTGYYYPDIPPPGQPANCGCVEKGRCAESQRAFTDEVIRTKTSTLVCGTEFLLCCYDDPWPGITDVFLHLAPCLPKEQCARPYGSSALDVRDFGSIGPCPGLETVRCLDGKTAPPSIEETGPYHFVIPIVEEAEKLVQKEVPPVYNVPEIPIVYNPPAPVPEVPIVYNPPAPVPEVPIVYNPPAPIPEVPIIYNPPAPVPEVPIIYNPPAPVTEPPVIYNPPAPVTEPPVIYNPPAPVTEPPVIYNPPVPVTEPPVIYSPPVPVTEPPVIYSLPTTTGAYDYPVLPPATTYGVPGTIPGAPLTNYAGYYRRFRNPYGYNGYRRYGGYIPGFGFRKSLRISGGAGFGF